MDKMLLIDGNLLLFRSFYAAYAINKESNNLTTHFFLTSILDVIKQENPKYIFIAFDAHAKTKRHEIYEEYKAGRTKPPMEIYEQKKHITTILDLAKIKWMEKAGDEADDLIATICTKYSSKLKIIIYSEDRDLYQLVDNNVSILVKDKKNKNNYIKINNQNFFEQFSIHPWQVIDYKSIAGDNSDNLKGIKGIGPKITIDLLSKYQNLENIYNNLSSLPLTQQEKFINSKEEAFLCKKLATLNRLVLLDIELNNLFFDSINFKSDLLIDELNKLNLKKLLSQLTK